MKRKKVLHNKPFFSIIIGILFVIVSVFSAFLFGRSARSDSIATLKEKYDLVIKTQTETAVSMLDALYQKHLTGELSLDQTKKMGEDLLRNLRYGNNQEGYFWADTTDGVNVVFYGKSDIEGTNRWDSFIAGVYYVRESIKNGMKDGGGFTEYSYPKKNESIPLPKRGYSLLFAPFNWVIGTGYYPEDIPQ